MCGISAAVTLQPAALVTEKNSFTNGDCAYLLERNVSESLQLIKHRGPDAQGLWVSPDHLVSLGHVRLSIVDLSVAGNQPFHDDQNDVHAVVVGEFYGHEVYRERLEKEYSFKSHSDCEILMALYNHYGISLLEHLNGEFAFCLWDNKRKLFFAAADRYLIKPFYYTVHDGKLLVGSEMKQFLAFGWQPEWDLHSLKEGGWMHDDRTFFRGVNKFRPGHYLLSKNFGPPSVQPYWDLEYPNKFTLETRTEQEMIETVRRKLIASVRVRLRGDVPVSVFLSGGLDSSCIAGIVSYLIQERGEKFGGDIRGDNSNLTCFTVAFPDDSEADESDIARRTADWLGARFQPVFVDEERIAEKFEAAIWHSEIVMPDANGPAKMVMAESVREKGFKVVLTGEGADEHFGGYTAFRADVLRERDYSWPQSHFAEDARIKALQLARLTPFIFWTSYVATRPDSTARMINHIGITRYLSAFAPLRFAPWTGSNVLQDNQETAIAESFTGCVRYNMAHTWHPLHTSFYCWMKSGFANNVLRYEADNVNMAYHLECRTPFLDHELTQYINSLPPSLKMKYCPETGEFTEKYILREAVRPFIPEEVYSRRKHMYLGPAKFPAEGPMHQLIRKIVTEENVLELGWIDWRSLKEIVKQGFVEQNQLALKEALTVAQFITISKLFGVKRASVLNSHEVY